MSLVKQGTKNSSYVIMELDNDMLNAHRLT